MSRSNHAEQTNRAERPTLRIAVDAHEDAPRLPRVVPAPLLARAGHVAALVERDGNERIEVRDPENRVLFELDTTTGRAVVMAPAGDLALAAPNGDIELLAGGSVRCRGARVELSAGTEQPASLLLGDRLAQLSARSVLFAAERLESVAERLFERAVSVFRKVEELHQLDAGRSRTLVKQGHDLRAGHVSIEAEDDVKLDGKRIRLG